MPDIDGDGDSLDGETRRKKVLSQKRRARWKIQEDEERKLKARIESNLQRLASVTQESEQQQRQHHRDAAESNPLETSETLRVSSPQIREQNDADHSHDTRTAILNLLTRLPRDFYVVVISFMRSASAACTSLLRFFWQNPPTWKHIQGCIFFVVLFIIYKVWNFNLQPALKGLASQLGSRAIRLLCLSFNSIPYTFHWLSEEGSLAISTVSQTFSSAFSWVNATFQHTSDTLSNVTTTLLEFRSQDTRIPGYLSPFVVNTFCSIPLFESWYICVGSNNSSDSLLYENISGALLGFGDAAINNTRLQPMVDHLSYSRGNIQNLYELVERNYLLSNEDLSRSAKHYRKMSHEAQRDLSSYVSRSIAATNVLSASTKLALDMLVRIELNNDKRWRITAAVDVFWSWTLGIFFPELSYVEEVLLVYDFWIATVRTEIDACTESSKNLIEKFEDLLQTLNSIKGTLRLDSHVTNDSDQELGKWYRLVNWLPAQRAEHERVRIRKQLIIDGTSHVQGALDHLNSAYAQYQRLQSLLDEAAEHTSLLHEQQTRVRKIFIGEQEKERIKSRNAKMKMVGESAKYAIEVIGEAYDGLKERLSTMEGIRDRAYVMGEKTRRELESKRTKKRTGVQKEGDEDDRDVVYDWTQVLEDGGTAYNSADEIEE